MARHHATKKFLRQMPNVPLARYFQRREVFGTKGRGKAKMQKETICVTG